MSEIKKKMKSPWDEAVERNEVLSLSYKVLIHALKSHATKKAKKIEISLALVKRRMPQDVNLGNQKNEPFMIQLLAPTGEKVSL